LVNKYITCIGKYPDFMPAPIMFVRDFSSLYLLQFAEEEAVDVVPQLWMESTKEVLVHS
jgi:hypothetical protein